MTFVLVHEASSSILVCRSRLQKSVANVYTSKGQHIIIYKDCDFRPTIYQSYKQKIKSGELKKKKTKLLSYIQRHFLEDFSNSSLQFRSTLTKHAQASLSTN